jgi:hypothetical protein
LAGREKPQENNKAIDQSQLLEPASPVKKLAVRRS